MTEIRKKIIFQGRVQGVGFRYKAKYLSQALNLTGWVKNEIDGTVTLEVQGRPQMIDKLLGALNNDTFIRIDWLDAENIPLDEAERGFKVRL